MQVRENDRLRLGCLRTSNGRPCVLHRNHGTPHQWKKATPMTTESVEAIEEATPRPKWTSFCFVKPTRHEIREGDDRIILIADVLPEHAQLICDAVNSYDPHKDELVEALAGALRKSARPTKHHHFFNPSENQ